MSSVSQPGQYPQSNLKRINEGGSRAGGRRKVPILLVDYEAGFPEYCLVGTTGREWALLEY